MKTEQELNNIRATVAADRLSIKKYDDYASAARLNLYHNMVILYKAENNLEVGDMVKFDWKDPLFGPDNIFEPIEKKEPIGKIADFKYTDYTGMQIFVDVQNTIVILRGNQVTKLS